MQTETVQLQPLKDEEEKAEQLRIMKVRASALLVFATLVFIVARVFESRWPWLGFVRATAEAAMVGGVADWFAVTALFRYPLGIKIPHTAIIPNRKDRIGRSLGNFVENNFLSRPVITSKLRSAGVAQKIVAWLTLPENATAVSGHVAVAVTSVVQKLRDDEVQEMIEQSLVKKVRATPAAPVIGNVLAMVTAGGRHQELFDSAIRLVTRLLDENGEVLRERVSRELPWWVPTPVDDRIYLKIVNGIEATLHELSVDPEHPLRGRFNEAVSDFVERLQNSPEMMARGEHIKEELLAHPAVRGYSSQLWADMKASLLRHSDDSDSEFRRRIARAVSSFAESLQNDEALLETVNGRVEGAVLYVVEQYRHEIAALIANTVAAWDPEDTTRKIELQVGKDLQFIRINGTLVGGLVGLLIYTVSHLIAG